ncbi:hypothetical protein HanIR_Chr13g0628971 [Helianthus annuus]|nr:hypothetical protein HanIR_Chr13g0628971 [Helianthus annuus]
MISPSDSLRSSSFSQDRGSWFCLELSPVSIPFPLSFGSSFFMVFCVAGLFLHTRLQPAHLRLFFTTLGFSWGWALNTIGSSTSAWYPVVTLVVSISELWIEIFCRASDSSFMLLAHTKTHTILS